MGERQRDFKFIGFLRDPRELIISKYNWYRNGWPYQRLRQGNLPFFTRNRNWWKPSLAHRVVLSQCLPLGIWARLYPFKPNAFFVTNADGQLDLDYVGLFESLQADFTRIFRQFGYTESELELPKSNTVKYESYSISAGVLRKAINRRARRDMQLIEEVKSRNTGPFTKDIT